MNTETAPNVIKEGGAEILIQDSKNVFYNPVQEFNRDLSVAVLIHYAAEHHKRIMDSRKKTLMGDKLLTAGAKFEEGVTILEAFSATGLRSIRYAREVPGVKRVLANDISELAVKSITANIAHNQVQGLVFTSHNDAAMVMYEHRKQTERFHCVDLDPYGCPSAFLDGAVQCVKEEGVLLVTCTDMALLCGNTPETCHAKYGAISLKSKACHEMALRIVLQCIESHANRYGRYIVPLLSVSADFYVRVFVRVRTSAAACKQSVRQVLCTKNLAVAGIRSGRHDYVKVRKRRP